MVIYKKGVCGVPMSKYTSLAGFLAVFAFFGFSQQAQACYCADKAGGGYICEFHCSPQEIENKLGAGHAPVEIVHGVLSADNFTQQTGSGSGTPPPSTGGGPENGTTTGGGTASGTPACYTTDTGDHVCPQNSTNTASNPGTTGSNSSSNSGSGSSSSGNSGSSFTPKPGIGSPIQVPPMANPTPTRPFPVPTGGGGSSPVNTGNAGTAYEWPPGFSPTPVCSEDASESVTNSNMDGLPTVGQITAKTGQVIQNVHVTSTDGPCINIPAGVSNVRITGSHIGPCGRPGDIDTYGVQINDNATNIMIDRNVIHDVSTGVVGIRAKNPIIMDRNCVYNIRGPFYRGQMVQFDNVSGGTSGSKITCNVVDTLGSKVSHVEDNINMFESSGIDGNPIEIAYNRIRGGQSKTGSGMVVGDGQKAGSGNNYYIHDNVIVDFANVGIGIVGGHNIRVENNRIYGEGTNPLQGTGITDRNFSGSSCGDHTIIGNRIFAREFAWGNGQEAHYINFNQCSPVTESGNVLGDKSLSADMFYEEIPECQ